MSAIECQQLLELFDLDFESIAPSAGLEML